MSDAQLSRRVSRVRFPPNSAARNRAAQLRAAGRDIIDLTMGEPDLETPEYIRDAALAAVKRGETGYPVARGTPALREAIREKLRRENGIACSEREIAIANGAKQIIYNAFVATLDEGDEVLIPAPFWTSFPDIVALAGGTSTSVACPDADGFKLTPEGLERALTPRTRWLILNSPGNPSGARYSATELAELAAVIRGYPKLRVLSDEVYEHLVFTRGPTFNLATVAPDLAQRTLLVFSCSKTYAMPAWRVGFAIGDPSLIDAMTVVQAQTTSGICIIAQAAAVAALTGSFDFVAQAAATYGQRSTVLVHHLGRTVGVTLRPPEGGLFAFPACAALRGLIAPDGKLIQSDQHVVDYLLESAGVAVVSGTAFGLPWHLRLSLAATPATLANACERIERALSALRSDAQ